MLVCVLFNLAQASTSSIVCHCSTAVIVIVNIIIDHEIVARSADAGAVCARATRQRHDSERCRVAFNNNAHTAADERNAGSCSIAIADSIYIYNTTKFQLSQCFVCIVFSGCSAALDSDSRTVFAATGRAFKTWWCVIVRVVVVVVRLRLVRYLMNLIM